MRSFPYRLKLQPCRAEFCDLERVKAHPVWCREPPTDQGTCLMAVRSRGCAFYLFIRARPS